MTKRILLVDYDNCAIAVQRSNLNEPCSKAPPHLISPVLIKHIKNGAYDGFMGLTQRCLFSVRTIVADHVMHFQQIKNMLENCVRQRLPLEKIAHLPDLSGHDVEDCFTKNITDNIQKLTGLPCLGVSTSDDKHGECGSGYNNIIKPIEEAILKTKRVKFERRNKIYGEWIDFDFALKMEFKQEPVKSEEIPRSTKNHQIKQTANYLSNLFGAEEKIEIDFVDDKMELVHSALSLAVMKDLPENVTAFSVYWHDALDPRTMELKGVTRQEVAELSVTASPASHVSASASSNSIASTSSSSAARTSFSFSSSSSSFSRSGSTLFAAPAEPTVELDANKLPSYMPCGSR
jgi:hypothetical protein